MHKVFGEKKNENYIDRKGAYFVAIDDDKIAVVKTPKGLFLLGGGLDKNESDKECIIRECAEEIGYKVQIDGFVCSAETYQEHSEIGFFHPIQHYYVGKLCEQISIPTEQDHKLEWVAYEQLKGNLFVPMQNWALEQCWQNKDKRNSKVYGAILSEGEKRFTNMRHVFNGINNAQLNYNWLITNCDCYHTAPEIQSIHVSEYSWLSGEELTEIVNKYDFQWVWAVLSGFDKSIPLSEVLEFELPSADGYTGFWQNPISIQHPLASIEIVAFDSALTLVISKDAKIVNDFRKAFPLSKDLEENNRQ